jgi:hypothetical protein
LSRYVYKILINLIIDISLQESARLIQEPVPGISAAPDDNNARYFKVVIDGPSEVLTLL